MACEQVLFDRIRVVVIVGFAIFQRDICLIAIVRVLFDAADAQLWRTASQLVS